MNRSVVALATVSILSSVACKDRPAAPEPARSVSASASAAPTAAAAPGRALDALTRAEFNRLAPELALPLFWTEDRNKNGALDPEELAIYWGLEKSAALHEYVVKGSFTPKLLTAYDRLVQQESATETDPRRVAVKKELAQGRVTLVATDLSKADPRERAFVSAILQVSELVETLYAKQQGTLDLAARLPLDDLASRTLFFRGQGARCEAPLTENDPICGALLPADMPKGKSSGLYPPELLAQPKFCDIIAKNTALADPFSVVVKNGEALATRKFHEAWPTDVQQIARELEVAAQALGDTEPALKAYVLAAAKGFVDDAWDPADEAWAKMDAKSSKYYLRVAPDEVYDEPCSTRALYHVSFGLINQGSLTWQSKLDPRKKEMEQALAALAGAPYVARDVTFKLPDFVDIAVNAGDSRKAFGATIGQSLPNFGPVANGGRGRTVAMTNFYTDPDSVASLREQAESMLCKEAMTKYTASPAPQLMSTVLHEAAHNLGPAHQYKTNGKTDREAFGGPLASTLEELKAQSAALYFTEWLVEKKEITREEADRAHVRDVFWAFGHISRGMYTEDRHPKNYSQLAAIQLGALMKDGAVTWSPDTSAANGKEKGCFTLDLAKMPAAITALMKDVAQVKAKGDRTRAENLIKSHVDVTGDKKKILDVITERLTRDAKASFVYALKID